MVSLRMAFHSITGRRVVHVFDNDGTFIATVYPDDQNNAVKVVSGYIDIVAQDDGSRNLPPVPAVNIKFRRMR